MFINPKTVIENGWVTRSDCKTYQDWDDRKFVSPNAIDFTLDSLKVLGSGSPAVISEHSKTMRQLHSVATNQDGNWHLNQGVVYDGVSTTYVKVPEGMAALLYVRSTLARNGTFLISGIFDAGYEGACGFTLYPMGGNIAIEPGTRVGQIAFIDAGTAKMYAGGYNHAPDTHYTEPADSKEKSAKGSGKVSKAVTTDIQSLSGTAG
jgi:deoxycytidine triphosphate deaminase